MLNADQLYILGLLRRRFQLSSEVTEPEVTEDLARLISHSGVMMTVFDLLPPSLQHMLDKKRLKAMKQALLQDHEGRVLLEALTAEGLDCVPLKGWELRRRYPRPEMRQMTDVDILIRPYQAEKIREIFARHGYRTETDPAQKHDIFLKGEVTVETHRRLTDNSGAIRQWEQEMWTRAVPQSPDGHLLRMSPEDEYIHHIVHLYTHFIQGALGLKRVVDTWLLGRSGVDMEAVERQLEAMGLAEFNRRMLYLGRAVMGEVPLDDGCGVMLAHAFRHGTHGTNRSSKASRIAASSAGSLSSGKLRALMANIFLPVREMKARYPELEKRPYLLPWCHGKRIVRFLFSGLKTWRRKADYSGISEEDVEEIRRFLAAGGIPSDPPAP